MADHTYEMNEIMNSLKRMERSLMGIMLALQKMADAASGEPDSED